MSFASLAQVASEKRRLLDAGFEVRERLESKFGLKYTPGADDTYYLHRLRIQAALQPNSWLRFFAQVQDSQAPWFSREPRPASFANTFDLRQGYAEFGRIEGKMPFGFRVGRQELRFGDARLIGPSNWSNGCRSWDAVRVAYRHGSTRLDVFAAAIVPLTDGAFDRPALRNGFYGLYSTTVSGSSTYDAYLLWKTTSSVRAESGRPGDLDVYTTGVRAAGRASREISYSTEMAVQFGHFATDRIRAWAGHWRIGYAFPGVAWSPELLVEYNRASGDTNPADGRRGTFDQLFPSNRDKYGTADRVTWRNIHNARVGLQLRPAAAWTWSFDLHNFWLMSRADGLYTDAGRLIALNRNATSSYVGPEIDLNASRQIGAHVQIAFGCSHLFAGSFLRQSVTQRGSTYPYVMLTYRWDR